MLSKEMILLQELLQHPGMEVFKNIVLVQLKAQLNDKLMAEARAGDQVRSASFAGQIDILPVIFKVAEDVLKKEMEK